MRIRYGYRCPHAEVTPESSVDELIVGDKSLVLLIGPGESTSDLRVIGCDIFQLFVWGEVSGGVGRAWPRTRQ